MMQNPFTPTFGIVPPFLAGRETILRDMRRAFQKGHGDPALCSMLIGPRGSGKTALLSCIANEARTHGYIVAETMAITGMLEDILQRALDESAEILSDKPKKQLTGLSVGQFLGIEWQSEDREKANWRSRMLSLLRALEKTDTGLLISVDEVRADLDEMVHLVAVYQLLIRDGAKCALVMAGLSVHCDRLIRDDKVSFLRRAKQYPLKLISSVEIDRAFRMTVESGGKKIQANALRTAVLASDGFPYMMQLVGFYIWEESGVRKMIQPDDADRGIEAAVTEFENGVLKSTYRDLSKGDRAFLMAMDADETKNRITDIANRMRKTVGYVSTYKTRLLEAGVIEETDGRLLIYSVPFLRPYLETQIASSS